jgi:hypothetical protein
MAAAAQGADRRIVERIQYLVNRENIRDVHIMKKMIQVFVEKELQVADGKNYEPTNRRFYPTDQDFRNHMYRAVVSKRYSQFDQDNLREKVRKWKEAEPSDFFHFRPYTTEDSDTEKTGSGLLFIYTRPCGKDAFSLDTARKCVSWTQRIVLQNTLFHCFSSV